MIDPIIQHQSCKIIRVGRAVCKKKRQDRHMTPTTTTTHVLTKACSEWVCGQVSERNSSAEGNRLSASQNPCRIVQISCYYGNNDQAAPEWTNNCPNNFYTSEMTPRQNRWHKTIRRQPQLVMQQEIFFKMAKWPLLFFFMNFKSESRQVTRHGSAQFATTIRQLTREFARNSSDSKTLPFIYIDLCPQGRLQ